ncbi:MAG TPA: DUF3540 domain-containing protein [Polyangiaceae bacterium]|jgi:hypothetical protein|nr:DUF3540 domain-containing protein [Polyangiaceae bacterium]
MGNEALAADQSLARGGVLEAIIVEIEDDARPLVRVVRPGVAGAEGAPARARIAVQGYSGSVGDRVLVTAHAALADLYVVGVLLAAKGPVLSTREGVTASVEGSSIAIRDASGALAVTYDAATGTARVAAPRGDLTLAAPKGKVVVDAATDIELRAQRDVRHRAARRIACEAGESAEPGLVVERAAVRVATQALDITSDRASLHTTEGHVLAERIETTAAQIVSTVGRMEVRAERLIERAKDAYRDVDGLLQTRAKRARSIIREAYQLVTERTSLVSKKETSIDGERVLLG